MKSLILFAALLVGIVACETPAPATGSETTVDSSATMSTTPNTSTDTTMSRDTTMSDTSKMKRDTM